MCLILLAWRAHPEYPLVFAGNRDESYDRPAASAGFWEDAPNVYGGRDLEKGGTWLGLTLTGRLAAVTNYRDGPPKRTAPRSRGDLPARFLLGDDAPNAYMHMLAPAAAEYNGYSLLAGNLERLYSGSNRGGGIQELPAGVHGLSNHLLNTPWPKVTQGKRRVAALLQADEPRLIDGLFDALADRNRPADGDLPDSGVGLQWERELAPAFIAAERYGTRASTVLLVNRGGEVTFIERRFGARGVPQGETARRFSLQTTRAMEAARVTKAAGQDV